MPTPPTVEGETQIRRSRRSADDAPATVCPRGQQLSRLGNFCSNLTLTAMFSMRTTPATVLLFIFAAASACAQYVPPSPAAPVPGAIDDYLRAFNPTFNAWDFGINERVRAEDKRRRARPTLVRILISPRCRRPRTATITGYPASWLVLAIPATGFRRSWRPAQAIHSAMTATPRQRRARV